MDDNHFLIDNAPPLEVTYSLLSFSQNASLSNNNLREILSDVWHYEPQKNYSNSSRRLLDLGLLEKPTNNIFRLTNLGMKVKEIYEFDNAIYFDIMHFLHNSSFYIKENPRKLFWSYRKCSDMLWQKKEILTNAEISNYVVNEINSTWPDLYSQKKGGNFNVGGVSSWKSWISELVPPPINDDGKLHPREIKRYEIVMLAIDEFYRKHNFRFGDPFVLSSDILDELSSIFFLDVECLKQLITFAAKFSTILEKSDTFAGMAITLMEHYSIERI